MKDVSYAMYSLWLILHDVMDSIFIEEQRDQHDLLWLVPTLCEVPEEFMATPLMHLGTYALQLLATIPL